MYKNLIKAVIIGSAVGLLINPPMKQPEITDFQIKSKPDVLFEITSDRIMRFYGQDGQVIGVLDFGQEPMNFEGEATESARIFLEMILDQFPDLCTCQK